MITFLKFPGLFIGLIIFLSTPVYAQPANDDCSGAITITPSLLGDPIVYTSATTVAATQSTPAASCNATVTDDDVWFNFTPASSSIVLRFNNVKNNANGNGASVGYALYTNACPALGTEINCEANAFFFSGYRIFDGLTPGTSYSLRIFSAGTTINLNFDVAVQNLPSAPANDECSGAIEITPQAFGSSCPSPLTISTVGATASAETQSCGTGGSANDDMWYKFTASSAATIIRFSGGSNPVSGAGVELSYILYSGSCGALTEIQCSGSLGFTAGYEIINGLSIGTEYTLRLYTRFDNNYGNFSFCLQEVPPAPVNDECAGAINIIQQPFGSSCTSPLAISTAGATASAEVQSCGNAGSANDDTWYKFTASSAAALIRFSSGQNPITGSGMELSYMLYTGVCGGLAEIECNNSLGFTNGYNIITNLTIGTEYYLRLYSRYDANYGSFNFCLQEVPAPPVNDNCSGAIAISQQPFGATCTSPISTSTSGATASPEPQTCGNAGSANDDIWYKFTASSPSAVIRFNNSQNTVTGAGMELSYMLYTGLCGSLNEVACNNSIGFTNGFKIIDGLLVGTEYYLRLYSRYENNYGAFDFCIQQVPVPPVNDDCTGATNVSVQPFGAACTNALAVNTAGATPSAEPQSCGNANSINDDLWYTFTATSAAVILRTLNVSNPINTSGGEVAYMLYTGNCNSLVEVGCENSLGFTGGYKIIDGLSIGTTYYLRLYSRYDNNYLSFNFCLQEIPVPPANDNCVGAFSVALTSAGSTCVSSITVDASGATGSAFPATCGTTADQEDDIWYSFVANQTSAILKFNNVKNTIDGSTGTLSYAIYEGSCPTSPVQFACNNNAGFSAGTITITALTPGTQYFIRFWSRFESNYLGFDFCLQDPIVNDECSEAVNVPVSTGFCTTPVSGSLFGATTSAGFTAPSCRPSGRSQDVFYKVTVPSTGAITIQTSPVSSVAQNLVLTAYQGVCGSLLEIACDDDGNPDGGAAANHARITLTGRTPGEVLILRVTAAGQSSETPFAICAWDHTTLPPVADGGNCVPGVPVTVSAANGNNYMWVPVVDGVGNIIAEVFPNGYELGEISSGVFVNSSAVRQSSAGEYYLDRNVALNAQNPPAGNINIRFYLKATELTALQAADPTIVDMNDLASSRVSGGCAPAYTGGGEYVPQTGNASYGTDYYLEVEKNTLSDWFFSKAGTVLPLRFISVEATRSGGDIILSWKIEHNGLPEKFVIEHSSDGRSFAAIGEQPGNAVVSSSALLASYSFGRTFGDRQTHYFRVMMLGVDGQKIYSDVRIVKAGQVFSVNIFPNPVGEILKVSGIPADWTRPVTRILQANGTTALIVKTTTAGSPVSLDVSALSSGFYILEITDPVTGSAVREKFFKK